MPPVPSRVHYDVFGDGPPVVLLSGLGGVGRGWGDVIELFAAQFLTIVPDHPGTGRSEQPPDGFTIGQHAASMAALLRELDCGPAHLVGSSTGGAIAQTMALDHRDVTRSIVLASSWARSDDFFRHQFAIRRQILVEQGVRAYTESSALFLYSPTFFRDHYDEIMTWVDQAAGADPSVMNQRIEMIAAFDESNRLGEIDVPTLIVVGDADACTPRHMSDDLASLIPNAELAVLEGGHIIYKERPQDFFSAVSRFLAGA